MPEGDTLFRTAATLQRALGGRTVCSVEGSHPAVRRHAARLAGGRIERVRAHGKHLLVEFADGPVLRTHLGMPGSWHLYRNEERWRRSPGAARVVLRTDAWVAVCFAAPEVEVASADRIRDRLERLGPDLITEEPDARDLLGRARRSDARTAAELLLDQRVAAGVGNVYKSELLFLEGVHPEQPVDALDDEAVLALYRRASRLLRANRSGPIRSTTGRAVRGGELWVYDRAERPCRRCGSIVRGDWSGSPPRITYWCPGCQPPGTSSFGSRENEP